MTVKITLACTECKQRNYNTTKNKKNNPDRLEMKKYCRFCKKHTVHRETIRKADNIMADKTEKKPGFVARMKAAVKGFAANAAKFFRDTKSELKKVVWPSKADIKTNTVVVLVTVAIAAVVMIALDAIFGGILGLIIGA